MKIDKLKTGILFLFLSFFIPTIAFGYTLGDNGNFYVEESFAENGAIQLGGELIFSSDKLLFYIEDSFWDSKTIEEQKEIKETIEVLNSEFIRKIYPGITSVYGSEAATGVDRESRITIFFHNMKDGVNGYTRNIDAFEKSVNPYSNQRKMIYLSTDLISGEFLKETLAHEFTHLITVNQKEIKYGVKEEKWLNEARAEYAVTLLGYNKGGNEYIQSRINSFLEKPYTSLTEWTDSSYNYGVVNSFIHYFVDYYGSKILADSLSSEKVGVESIEEALLKNGYKDSFSQIFTNWTIATYINDCTAGAKYCFKDENFKKLYVIPFSNYMPFSGESTLYTGQTLSNFSAHWQRYAGGKEEMNIKLYNPSGSLISVPYIIKRVDGTSIVRFLNLEGKQEAEFSISGIGESVGYITVIPSLSNNNLESDSYFYSLTARTFSKDIEDNTNNNIKLPFEIDKPLSQMNKEELLMVIIKVIIYLLVQGKTII